jgi:hypothetical protein
MTEAEVLALIAVRGYSYEKDECGSYLVDDGCETELVLDFMGDKVVDIYAADWT